MAVEEVQRIRSEANGRRRSRGTHRRHALRHANAQGASDIHIEPLEGSLLIRYRIDGILHDAMELPKHAAAAITARIKVLASMRSTNTACRKTDALAPKRRRKDFIPRFGIADLLRRKDRHATPARFYFWLHARVDRLSWRSTRAHARSDAKDDRHDSHVWSDRRR
jgi:hypothetical protein